MNPNHIGAGAEEAGLVRSAGDRRPGLAGLLTVILFCLVTSELMREGLSSLEVLAASAATVVLAAAEVTSRCRSPRRARTWWSKPVRSATERF